MRRCVRAGAPALIAVAMAVGLGACGKRAAPLAPLRLAPARVAPFTARRIGSTVYLRFAIPDKNDNGSMPADLDHLEVVAFTDDPVEAVKAPLANRVLPVFGTVIARVEVRPPPPPEPKTAEEQQKGQAEQAAKPAPPADPRPGQGEAVMLTEEIDAKMMIPVDRAKVFEGQLPDPPPLVEEKRPVPRPLVSPPIPQPLLRFYTVIGVGRKGQLGQYAARLAVPLGDVPGAPSAPSPTFVTQGVITLAWKEPADAPVRVQPRAVFKPPTPPAGAVDPAAPAAPADPAKPPAAPPAVPDPAKPPAAPAAVPDPAKPPAAPPAVPDPAKPPAAPAAVPDPAKPPAAPAASPDPAKPSAAPGAIPPQAAEAPQVTLAARSLAPQQPLYRYNVYEASSAAGAGIPLNPVPLIVPNWGAPGAVFGQERCFAVRAVKSYGVAIVESEASPPACITPTDIFPPPPPVNLTGVATEGAISLIWEGPSNPDVAGYIVLRGEAPGEKLDELTPAPITGTTYRDASVRPGIRYVYVVVAVDRATPPNRSTTSNRFEESAR